jgi:hypothetical protein
MGLFSTETKIYVSSVIYPLGEDDTTKIPDVVKASVIAAGMQGTSRARAIDKAIFDGLGVKLAQGYNYARKHYYAGLPTGFPVIEAGPNNEQLTLLVKEYLAGVYPPPANTVVVNTATVTYADNYDTRFRQLVETEFSYDFYDEAVHTANNGLAIDATLDYEQLPYDDLNHPNEIGWKLTFTNPNASVVEITKWYSDLNFAGQESIEKRIVIEYSLNGAPSATMYYTFGGSDARLNIYLRMLETPESGTFPAIVLKKALSDKKAVYLNDIKFTGTAWETGAAYKTSKEYAARMDIDIDEILATLQDNAEEKQIDYAFIQPGTRLNSTTLASKEYHYRYFDRLRTSFPNNKAAFDAWVAAYGGQLSPKSKADGCPAQSIRILDPDDTKNSVNMVIAWRYITYEEKVGTLPATYTMEYGPQETLNSNYLVGRAAMKSVTFDASKLYLRKRLTDNTYAELCVCGLWHENYVYKGKKVQSSGWAAINDPEGDFGSGFLIPLEYEVFVSLSGRERLQLAQEAFHLVLNCFQVVKKKWYQQGIFGVILAVIAIAVIVFSGGSLTGPVLAIYSSVSAAVGAVLIGVSLTVIAAVAAVITGLIIIGISMTISFVAKEAGEWAAEQWGPEWGALVSIVAVIAVSWAFGAGLENIGVAIPAATLPMTVLNVTNMILVGLSTYTNAEFAQLREAQSKWNDYITSPNNPMEELKKMMEQYFPEDLMRDVAEYAVLWPPKENLDEFLGRTLSLVDGLTYRLTMPINRFTELTLTPRLT